MSRLILILSAGFGLLFGAASHAHRCPLGFISFKNSCYWFSINKASFAEAGFMCLYMKSHLAVIKSSQVMAFLRGHLTRHGKGAAYFVGGSDLRLEGRFSWEGEETPITYQNWSPGQPNNYDNNNHCIALVKGDSFQWNDYPCEHLSNFICEV